MFRTFQNKHKQNFEVELLENRLDYARYLLTQTLEPLGKIASDCGWNDERDFAKFFQTRVGVTPAHYRDWHQH